MGRPRRDERFGATDLRVEDHGSVCLLRGCTKAGQDWLESNVLRGSEVQTWGGAAVVEPRYLGPILQGIADDGLTVSA